MSTKREAAAASKFAGEGWRGGKGALVFYFLGAAKHPILPRKLRFCCYYVVIIRF